MKQFVLGWNDKGCIINRVAKLLVVAGGLLGLQLLSRLQRSVCLEIMATLQGFQVLTFCHGGSFEGAFRRG